MDDSECNPDIPALMNTVHTLARDRHTNSHILAIPALAV